MPPPAPAGLPRGRAFSAEADYALPPSAEDARPLAPVKSLAGGLAPECAAAQPSPNYGMLHGTLPCLPAQAPGTRVIYEDLDSGLMRVTHTRAEASRRRRTETSLMMFLSHYLLWGPLFVVSIFLVYLLGTRWLFVGFEGMLARRSAALGLATLPVLLYLRLRESLSPTRSDRSAPSWIRESPAWGLIHTYMPFTAIRTTRLNPNRRYVFASHPHGILVLSRLVQYGGLWGWLFPTADTVHPADPLTETTLITRAGGVLSQPRPASSRPTASQGPLPPPSQDPTLPKPSRASRYGIPYRILGATPIFRVPINREFAVLCGLIDASLRYAVRALTSGQSVQVFPGGSAEIFMIDPDMPHVTRVFLRKRKGFIRLALQQGCDLVPMVCFGEEAAFRTWKPAPAASRFLLRTLKMPFLLFWGRFFSLLPRQGPLTVVYGSPLVVPDEYAISGEPVPEGLVDEYHERYISLLQDTWDTWRIHAPGYEQAELIIE
ncbi:hypothetical protein H696_02918 [Fonticula alba]|uniref:Acyltransferase n=1 Tax=Fonticula alba TaxID=691883 RepID=A0A058ZAW8_FONAL|nr:hypothetical protein H696_02918 [Fonticula alba]KCV70572.1 hypothetical protein H696_02918 [Fonticula alba]|eukprot:XP_009495088.1 hypothetical protein H696_02918 [Fonticula alba]